MDLELLAPAGTVPAFEAALAEGADAIYLGAPAFNARALARDFSFAEIGAMIQAAHGQGKKVYLAMNSLVKEEELRQAVETLYCIAQMDADALIVQDLGLLHLGRRFVPQLPMHASTLMAAHNSLAVEYLAGLGCRRIVLARELSLVEISRISECAARLGVELELFVHGAMCFSYSGLCRFSSLHGGKSSLRGQCVQPCRRRYQWLNSGKPGKSPGAAHDGGYLFSMNDLSGINKLDGLAAAGVRSLKIEGRLKSVAYVRNTVRAYRLALDARSEQNQKLRTAMLAEAQSCLDAAMGRRGSSGFFADGAAASAGLISPEQSGNTGTLAGVLRRVDTVRHQNKTVAVQLSVQLRAAVRSGDRLRLHDERSDSRFSFTLRVFRVAGKTRQEARAGELVEMRVADAKLGSIRPPFQGKLYRVDVSGRTERISEALQRLIARQKLPSLPAELKARIDREIPGPESGEQEPFSQAASPRRGAKRSQPGQPKLRQMQWWLQAASLEALRCRFPFAVSRFLLELTADNIEQALSSQGRRILRNTRLTWVLPPVILEERLDWYRQALARLQAAGWQAFQLGHPSQIQLFAAPEGEAAAEPLELFGDWSCNVLNHAAIQAMASQGFRGLQFSLETDRQTLLTSLAAHAASSVAPAASHATATIRQPGQPGGSCAVGLLLYGRPALFTSRLQAPHFKGRHSLLSPHGERYFLRQEEDTVAVYPHQPFSLLAHGRELGTMSLHYFVVDISHGHPKREAALVAALFSGKGEVPPHFSGNYGGVLA